MKTIFKQLIFILFSGIMVIASGGFNLVHHYCSCSQNINTTILFDSPGCDNEGTEDHCGNNADIEEPSCCQQKNNDLPTNQSQCDNGKNCCSSEYSFFKTDTFDLSGKTRINPDLKIVTVTEINDYQNQDPQSDFFIQIIDYDLPPPDYGKELLFSLHQLKIATPLV